MKPSPCKDKKKAQQQRYLPLEAMKRILEENDFDYEALLSQSPKGEDDPVQKILGNVGDPVQYLDSKDLEHLFRLEALSKTESQTKVEREKLEKKLLHLFISKTHTKSVFSYLKKKIQILDNSALAFGDEGCGIPKSCMDSVFSVLQGNWSQNTHFRRRFKFWDGPLGYFDTHPDLIAHPWYAHG